MLFDHSLIWIMIPACQYPDEFSWSSNSSMNSQWCGTLREMITITGDTDYYCIIKLSYSPLVYCFCVTVIICDTLVTGLHLPHSVYNNNIRNVCYLITPSFG